MKYSQWIGIAAAIILVIACFLPWTFHPDLNKNFTGFFSEHNIYGKPGYVFIVVCAIAVVFFCIPRLWAKRWNIFVGAVILSYAIKSFIVYSGCYRAICPDKKAGLWRMLLCSILLLVMALFPDIVKESSK